MTLPCGSCREYAIVGYETTDHADDNTWTCPSCGKPNRLRLKGRLTDATRRTI